MADQQLQLHDGPANEHPQAQEIRKQVSVSNINQQRIEIAHCCIG